MPLKISANEKDYTVGPEASIVKTPDDVMVAWAGDRENTAIVRWPSETELARFNFPVKGVSAEVRYYPVIRDVDGNFGSVRRLVKLERI